MQVNRCFVIGPIGNKFDPIGSPGREAYEEALQVFEAVILPACEANGLKPVRADQIAVAGDITEQIFRHLYEDEVVIADVSGGNPNVMYELGLRHTRNMLTIQLGEYGQLPFDVQAVRTIQFSRSDRGLVDARKQLERVLLVGLSEGPDPVAATRIWDAGGSEEQVPAAPPSLDSRDTATPLDPDDEAGLIERMADMEESFPLLFESLEAIGGILERLGAEAEDSSREFQTAGGTELSARERLTVVTRFAARLQPTADELTSLTDDFESQLGDLDGNVTGILAFLETHPDQTAAGEADEFLASIISLATSSRESMEQLGQFGGVVRSLGALSKALRRPTRQISASVDSMAKAAAVMDDWEAAAHRIQNARPDPAET